MGPRTDLLRAWICSTLLFLFSMAFSNESLAGGGRRPEEPPPSKGKSVITLEIEDHWVVELPDRQTLPIGDNLRNSVVIHLGNGDVAEVIEDIPSTLTLAKSEPRQDRSEWIWNGSFTPAADVRIRLRAATFETGSKGNRSSYGIDERFQDDFSFDEMNEFPLRTDGQGYNWFPRSFRRKGFRHAGSHSGLLLGDGFSINFFFAFLTVKWANYEGRVLFDVDLANRFDGSTTTTQIETIGSGFFFDVSGGYMDYSLGISLARSDAMIQAFEKAINQALEAVTRSVKDLPLLAKVDHIVEQDGETIVLLGAGAHPRLQQGLVYRDTQDLGLQLEVLDSNESGAITRWIAGPLAELRPGQLFVDEGHLTLPEREEPEVPGDLTAISASLGGTKNIARSETVKFENHNLKQLKNEDLGTPSENGLIKMLEDIVGFFLLPYRIWRYHRYDREYHLDQRDGGDFANAMKWSEYVAGRDWAKVMNLHADSFAGSGVRVAVIDTGIDYRHQTLHGSIWQNVGKTVDSRGRSDEWGFDFLSGDARAYDDHFHGTMIASAVLAGAPAARLIPIKAFNPWGITRSAALIESFRFAIDSDAQMIVCAWASEVNSVALKKGVRLAEEAGILVVVSAGMSGKRLPYGKAFPAEWNQGEFSNLVVVGAINKNLRRWDMPNGASNYGSEVVDLMAVGMEVEALEPRGGKTQVSSTDVATGWVAGVAAAQIPRAAEGTRALEPMDFLSKWKNRLLEQTRQARHLIYHSRGGRYLYLKD